MEGVFRLFWQAFFSLAATSGKLERPFFTKSGAFAKLLRFQRQTKEILLKSKHFFRLGLLLLGLWGLAGGLEAAAPSPGVAGSSSSGDIVVSLTVTGNRSISGEKVLALVRQPLAAPVNLSVLNEDIKRIWRMGLFQDVSVESQPGKGGVVLNFKVSERPVIQEVRFFGNKEVGDGTLRDKCGLKAGETLDQDKLAMGVREIEKHYKGKYYYAVQVKVDVKPGVKAGEVVVNFRVDEGNRMKVETIEVTGNKAFSASRIKSAMKDTKEAGFISGGAYDPDKLYTDLEEVLKLYAREGYAKAEIDGVGLARWGDKGRGVVRNATTFDEANKRIVIKFNIVEGPKYRLLGVRLQGCTLFTEKELLDRLRSDNEKIFDQQRWDDDMQRIRSAYSEKGYIYANVQPDFEWNDAEGTVSALVTITENSKAYIEDIRIRGNEVTKDKVIRRVLTLQPGDPFDAEAVNRNKMRIYNLGFFENVAVDTQPGSEMDKLILIFDVSPERKTGTLSLGAGYSSVEGLVGFLQVSQNNLFGNGQSVSAQWDFGTAKQSYSLSFTEPWLLDDRPLSLGVDVYKIARFQSYNSQGFNQESTGGSLRLGYAFRDAWDGWRVFGTYRYQSDVTSNVQPGLNIPEGTENTSSITPSISRDTRDNIFDATRGSYNILSVTLAGFYLGGDNHFIKPVFDSRLHFQTPAILGQDWLKALVLSLHGRVGWAVPEAGPTGEIRPVPVAEKFFMGGTDTVRGYPERGLGGQVYRTGGDFLLLSNIEYGFKPATPLKLRVFYDSGNVWRSNAEVDWSNPYLYPSWGFGMLFTIPTSVIQIRLDWGIPLVDVPEFGTRAGQGKLHFNIGNIF